MLKTKSELNISQKPELLIELSPLPSIRLQHGVGSCRAPGSRSVIGEILDRVFGPGFENGSHQLPGCFHAVAVREQCSVAEHCVEKQALISVCRTRSKCVGVAEVHVHRTHAHI